MDKSAHSGGTRGSGSNSDGSVNSGRGGSTIGGALVGGEAPAPNNGHNVRLKDAAARSEDFVIIPIEATGEPRTNKGKEVASSRPTTCTTSLLHYFNNNQNSLNIGPLNIVSVAATPPISQRLSQTMADLVRRRREQRPKPREMPLQIGSPRRDEGNCMPQLPCHISPKGKEKMPETSKSRAKEKINVPKDLSVQVPIPMDVDIAEGAQVFVIVLMKGR